MSFRQTLGSDGKPAVEKSSIGHLVAFEDKERFGERLFQWQTGRGLREGMTHVVTADGAPWIWDLVDTVFPGAVQIVDFFHAGEHLMELCRLQCPGKDGKAAEELFGMRRRMLKAHGAASLIRYFEEHGPQSPNAAAIDERLNYFRVNERRMRYGEFRRKGYVIGSGAVEGACRSVINQRADLSGQRWHPDGALNVLRIRGMVMDGIHEDYWKRRGTVRRLEVA